MTSTGAHRDRGGATPVGGGAEEGGWRETAAAPAAHILLVEDDAVLRTLLTELLARDGYEVTAVGDGRSALRALTGAPVHAMLTDLHLPDMDGLEVLKRAAQSHPRTVGLVMTGHGTVDLAVKAMKAGAVDFLTKPFQPDVVSLTLRRVLEVQRLRQENAILKHTVLKQAGIQVKVFEMEDMDGGRQASRSAGRPAVTQEMMQQEFERGLAEGERRACEREGARLAQQSALLGTVAQQVEQAYKALLAQVEEQAAALAFEIARRVVHECADEKRSVVLSQVAMAVARVRESVREQGLVRVRVHPDDLPAVEAARDAVAGAFDGPVTLVLEADPSISRGGCHVQTGTRFVDATLESQLARLAEPFRRRAGREAH